MRTTGTLDDDVQRLLQDEMHAPRLPFKQCLNDVLRAGFRAQRPAGPKFVVKAQPMGLRAGIDPNRLNQLADELEDEYLIERMRAHEVKARAPGKHA